MDPKDMEQLLNEFKVKVVMLHERLVLDMINFQRHVGAKETDLEHIVTSYLEQEGANGSIFHDD